MKAYVYNFENRKVIAVILGDNEQTIEDKYDECFDSYATSLTYSPEFDDVNVLVRDDNFKVIVASE